MKYLNIFLWSAIGLSALLMTCNVKKPTENIQLTLNLDPIKTVISGTVVNAATAEPITDATVNLTVDGADRDNVVDLGGTAKTEYDLDNGIVSFALTESADPTPENPVRLLLIVQANGYLTTSLPIQVIQEGSFSFKISMIKLDQAPEGIMIKTGEAEANNEGVIQDPVEIIVTEPVTLTESKVYLPKGLILKDAQGNPLEGKLDILVIYNNNQNITSLNAFPGGFNVTVEKDGTLADGMFVSAGLVTVEITDQTGRKAKTFTPSGLGKASNPRTVSTTTDSLPRITVGVPGATYNPETENQVQDGDEIDIWIYDTASGIWEHQTRDTITGPNDNGNFSVDFNVSHLSPCNPDWWIQGCLVDRTIHIIGNDNNMPLKIHIRPLGGSGYIWSAYGIFDQVHLYGWFALNLAVRIEVWTDCGSDNILVGSVDIQNLCGTGDITIPVQLPDRTTSEKTILVSGYCECKPDLIIRPSGFPIWMRSSQCGAGWIFVGTVENGQLTIKGLETGVTYFFATWYEGRYYCLAVLIEEDAAVYIPNLSTAELIEEVEINGDVISYVLKLPSSVCTELCGGE